MQDNDGIKVLNKKWQVWNGDGMTIWGGLGKGSRPHEIGIQCY